MVMVRDNIVLCPECGGRMVKAGKVWSGRERKQQYLCTGCGRKVVLPAQEVKD